MSVCLHHSVQLCNHDKHSAKPLRPRHAMPALHVCHVYATGLERHEPFALPLGRLSQHAFPNLLALPAISVAKLYPQCQATRCSDLRGRHLLNNCTNVLGCCTPSLVGSSPKNQFNTFPLTYRLASHTCVVNMARNMTLTLLSSCWTP